MKQVSLQEAYKLLKKFKHCLFDDETSTLVAQMNKDGLVLKIKNNVILFPHENNDSVTISEDAISLNDVNNWNQIIKPLIPAQLI
jgi:hypothetical protein